MSDDRGIVVLGFPRSGTTLLRRLLDAHPRIACPPETGVLAGAARFLREERIDSGVTFGVGSGLALAGLPEEQTRAKTRAFVCGLLADVALLRGKVRWAEKHPYDVFHLSAIEGLLGDHVRWVVVLRHPLDIVVSVQDLFAKTGSFLDPFPTYISRDPRPLHATAAALADVAPEMLALAARRNAVVVRYENLVSEPLREVTALFAGLGEQMPEDLIATALSDRTRLGFGDWKTWSRDSIDKTSLGRWSSLSRAALAELVSRLGPTLDAWGYPRPPVQEVGDALRRQQLALMAEGLRKR